MKGVSKIADHILDSCSMDQNKEGNSYNPCPRPQRFLILTTLDN